MNTGDVLILVVLLAVMVFLVISLSKSIKAQKKLSKEKKEATAALKEKGVSIHATFPHLNGLPVAENVPCEFFSYPDRYEIKSSGMTFNLVKDKITDVCTKTETEIHQQYVSSVGGAVGGAIMFGAVGAMIGGRAKKKETRTNETFLIITYLKEEEVKYIGFNVTYYMPIATKIVNEFKENRSANQTTQTHIEL